jgi:hypothetical protein
MRARCAPNVTSRITPCHPRPNERSTWPTDDLALNAALRVEREGTDSRANQHDTHADVLRQKYTLRVNWYPSKAVKVGALLSAQGTSHMLGETLTWSPLSCLYFQRSANVTLAMIRRISDSIRWTLKYGFFKNQDEQAGGHDDYDAHLVSTNLPVQF